MEAKEYIREKGLNAELLANLNSNQANRVFELVYKMMEAYANIKQQELLKELINKNSKTETNG